jgi:pseudaminic acid synthase
MSQLKIGTFEISSSRKPMIIAELSGNHGQSLAKALRMVEAAAWAGVDAVKLQTYTADTMTLDLNENEFFISEPDSLWQGKTLYELYESASTPWAWHEEIMDAASKLGMLCFSSAFDESSVDFLESIDVPAYKIASFENTDIPLLQKVGSTGKPILISTGMASVSEIDEAVRAIRSAGPSDIVLLKCTSTYPASPDDSNVLTIPHMRSLFQCEVGLSDHTRGIGAAVAAVAHGATVIEKHFVMSRTENDVDAPFSLEPAEMRLLVEESERAWRSLGRVAYGPTDAELDSVKYRRSLYIAEDLVPGDKLTTANLRCVRPGRGLPPKYYKMLLGCRVNCQVKKGSPMRWHYIDGFQD